MKMMGLELPGMGGGGGGGGGGEGGGRKREVLMGEARYGVGSVLVEEGASPTTVFVVVEGECRIVKGKPLTQPPGEILLTRPHCRASECCGPYRAQITWMGCVRAPSWSYYSH